MSNQSVIIYNAMIAGFLQGKTTNDEYANEAFNLFSKMQKNGIKPSKFTFSSMLKVCNAVEAFDYGKQIHAQICKRDLQSDEFIGSALIDLYFLSISVEDGVKCFALTSKLDIVSWTSIISGYVQNGHFGRALALFYELLSFGRKPDEFIISSMLGACSNLASPRSGQQIQGYAIKIGIGKFTMIQNSQICMYTKSGDIDSAHLTFEEMDNPDVVSWSMMISSNAQHGCARKALRLFELMMDYGIAPNHIMFLGVLTACSHGGLVKEELRYFESMKKDYCMTVNNEVDRYLQAVDEIQRSLSSTTINNESSNNDESCLNSTIRIAMAWLEDEFRNILLSHTTHLEVESISFNSDSDCHGSAEGRVSEYSAPLEAESILFSSDPSSSTHSHSQVNDHEDEGEHDHVVIVYFLCVG
nr:pentatricopeptide repeat-containing protein [Quercus suber]